MSVSRIYVTKCAGASVGTLSLSISGLGSDGAGNCAVNVNFNATVTATNTNAAVTAAVLATPQAAMYGVQLSVYNDVLLILVPDVANGVPISILFGNTLSTIYTMQFHAIVPHAMPVLDAAIVSKDQTIATLTSQVTSLSGEIAGLHSDVSALTAELAATAASAGDVIINNSPSGQGSAASQPAQIGLAILAFSAGLALGNSSQRPVGANDEPKPRGGKR